MGRGEDATTSSHFTTHLFGELLVVPCCLLLLLLPKKDASTTGPGGLFARAFGAPDDDALGAVPGGAAAAAAAAALAALDWFLTGDGATESVCWGGEALGMGCEAHEPSFPDLIIHTLSALVVPCRLAARDTLLVRGVHTC